MYLYTVLYLDTFFSSNSPDLGREHTIEMNETLEEIDRRGENPNKWFFWTNEADRVTPSKKNLNTTLIRLIITFEGKL